MTAEASPHAGREGRPAAGSRGLGVAVLLLFLATRLPLVAVRAPFYDELLTVWVAQHSVAEQWALMEHDSGSPLFYALGRLLEITLGCTVPLARLMALAFGLGALVLCLRSTPSAPDGERVGLAAAALLAAFPPHVYLSAEGRAYSLVALLIGLATVALDRFRRDGESRALGIGTVALVLAAYTHAYGVLSFPLPAIAGLFSGRRAGILKGAAASVAAGLLFVPGFLLAGAQPAEAIAWMEEATLSGRLALVVRALGQLGFAADYPSLFFPSPPPAARLLSGATVAALALHAIVRRPGARFAAAATLVPLLFALVAAFAGRTVYYPVRFECTLAVPFCLWIGASVASLARAARLAALAVCLSLGAIVAAAGALDHARRPPDPYRAIALQVRRDHDPRLPIVASGYTYLEVLGQRDGAWQPEVRPYPASLGRHPAWTTPDPPGLAEELATLPPEFLWVGMAGSAELRALATARRLHVFRTALPSLALHAGAGPPGLVSDPPAAAPGR